MVQVARMLLLLTIVFGVHFTSCLTWDANRMLHFSRSLPGHVQSAERILNRFNLIDTMDDDFDSTTVQLIRENGYPAEEHTVTTEDGYILTMHRIPHGRSGSSSGVSKEPVLVQHGLLGSSSDWIMQPPDRALAYMLADRGYDVWLGNARGNEYSRHHVNLTAAQPGFWKFTWDEMGRFDLPAVIDYVLATTSYGDLYYVGHSMGTTMFWVLMHEHPEYSSKVRLMHALAPIAKVRHIRSPVRLIAPFSHDVEKLSELFGLNEFLPSHGWVEFIARFFCEPFEPTRLVCANMVFLLAGADSQQLNSTALPVILAHTPAGTSTRTVVHYAQEVSHDDFLHFDWGRQENLARYGQPTPPEYSLSHVKCPVVLMMADNDILADPVDVSWLAARLPNVIESYRVPFPEFNHIDFTWAIDADHLVYNHLIENLIKY